MNGDIYYPPSLLWIFWECVLANSLSHGDLMGMILSWDSSQRLTLPTDFSEDARSRFASLLLEPEIDNPGKRPFFCLSADHLAREVDRILFTHVTPSLSVAPSQLGIKVWAHSETQHMFSPSARLEFLWNNLVFLAFPHTRSLTYTQTVVPTLRTMNTP
jgi:hypothetical protein